MSEIDNELKERDLEIYFNLLDMKGYINRSKEEEEIFNKLCEKLGVKIEEE